jgi:hypothetical protein
LGVEALAVGTMTSRAAASAFAFYKRAGQHLAQSAETADESAAQFQVGVAGRLHMTLIIVSVMRKVKHLRRFAEICKNAERLNSEWKPCKQSRSKPPASLPYGITEPELTAGS